MNTVMLKTRENLSFSNARNVRSFAILLYESSLFQP
jgi:hypothetical protein